ncbi:hypothetical protein BGZ89_007029 [Linnemannia elongata]|nr:hypothetical protein BGZ89_007029 [Linnemannia elongata]
MPKKRNPYLSPQDIAALLSPPPHLFLPPPPSPTTIVAEPQNPISAAFDNTLITDSIFQYLSPRDTATCLTVSKTWYTVAHLHRWKSVTHYYTHQPHNYDGDPLTNPRFQWWQPTRDDRFLDAFGKILPSWPIHSHSPSPLMFISAKQKELICRNAFRVKSLRIDYSAQNLMDVPFGNLTRFSLNCRYILIKDRAVNPGGVEDERLKEVALEVIARNPKLKELELSYVESHHGRYGWYRGDNSPPPLFAVRVLQVLQRHHHQSSSTSTINTDNNNNNNNESGLYSLKLFCQGNYKMDDLCSVIENCPPSLRELTFHGYFEFYNERLFPVEQVLLDRFTAIKNNSIHNNYYASVSTTTTNSLIRQRTPNLRLLNIGYVFPDLRGYEDKASIPEITLSPILSCFPDLQDLFLPKLSDNWISLNCPELISILTISCPSLTNINFGNNFIPEEHMHRFLLSLPKGQLQEITMSIRPDFLERVLPILLERSASTLKVIRLRELSSEQCDIHLQRSSYVLEILTSCPRLKTLAIVPSPTDPWSPELHLHDLLQKDWVCSELEVLSIGVLDLATPSKSNVPNNDKDTQEDTETTSTDNPELALYRQKIQTLTSFYLHLKSRLPLLTTLDFQWSKSCKDIPYDCAVEHSNSLLTLDNLRWMGLRWWAIYGLKTTAVREALGALSKKETELFEKYMWQGKGIYVWNDEDERRGRWWGQTYCCSYCRDMEEMWSPWEDWEEEEGVFEDLHDAYKSRSNRRRHGDAKWKK